MANNDSINRYNQRGVSSSKEEVHQVVDRLDRGCFPGAFCKVTDDFLTGNEKLCNVIHSDGAGTKSILAYLWYKETGDAGVFRGIAQDSIVMNLDDLACVGIWDDIILSSTVNRNARNFPAEALAQLIEGTEEFIQTLRDFGVKITSGGGETADVGDLTGTVAVDSCAVAIAPKNKIVDNAKICPDLCIVGLSSSGQASYEQKENSGIGSNGLTSARHEMLSPYYRENFPETFDPLTNKEFVYCGPFRLKDSLINSSLLVGEALLSPTRTYIPIVKNIMSEKGDSVYGLVHCSGGGQTKCMRFGTGVHHVKDNLFSPPSLFQEIQRVSGTSDKEMHQVYNMGHRFEIYCKPDSAEDIISISKTYNIEAQIIGHTKESSKSNGQNHLTIDTGKVKLNYG